MKLCLVNSLVDEEAGGGAERSTGILARELAKFGNEVTLIGLTPGSTRRVSNAYGVEKVELPLQNCYWPFDGQRTSKVKKIFWHLKDRSNYAMGAAVAAELERLDADVVITSNLAGFSTAVWEGAKKQSVPIVHIVRDYYLLCPNSTMTRGMHGCKDQCIQCSLLRSQTAKICDTVNRFLSISDYVGKVHERIWRRPGIFCTIGNPIEPLTVLQADQPKRDALRFGYIGRLVPTKGVKQAISAYKCAAVGGNLLVAGNGPSDYIIACRKAAVGANVRFLGWTAPSDFFGQIDVLVVPSQWDEAFGRVVVEAASAGIPSVVSARGALPELVRTNETGWIFNDFKELEQIFRSINDSPERLETMRTPCMRLASSFLPSGVAGRVNSILCELVSEVA